ncbi:MAG TPA: glycoside hydrolase family 3 N-terminal domain-containing protein, partial [Clostridia bacterium]
VRMCKDYQDAAMSTPNKIPIIYGIDAVHGHNTVYGAVVFPHNIGLGAANDPALMSKIASVTASEMIATGVNWDFGPCVAVARDIRWGRTYESFGEDPNLVSSVSVPFIQTLQEQFGITATAKHFLADGGTKWGTGYNNVSIDQGNAVMSEEELDKIHLPVYEAAVKAGVKTVMVSFSSWNGIKNHENKHLIQEVLKDKLGFKGFVISDYEAIHQLSGSNLDKQLVASVNAGVDMFMEPRHWRECIDILKGAVKKGDIKEVRINDAVSRILKVKLETGLFENPTGEKKLAASNLGEEKNKEIARNAVKESLVLLKNDKNILPLRKNARILVFGPAADNVGIQCGGWTKTWQGGEDKGGSRWMAGSTILDGFKKIAGENGGTIVTDIKTAGKVDAAIVVIGEKPYAEYMGDDKNLDLYSGLALQGNREAINKAKALGVPVVTVMVSGRPRIVTDEIGNWSAFVEAWLPGTEGAAVADVLYGNSDFRGKLPVTWPKTAKQIPIHSGDGGNQAPLFPQGFGLTTQAAN